MLLLLVAGVLAPVAKPVFEARPANAQTVAAALAAACGTNPVCLAALTAAVAWVTFSDTSPWQVAEIEDLVGWLGISWGNGGDWVDQMTAQYGLHPYYVTVTPEMVAAWQDALMDLVNYGFTFESVGGYQSLTLKEAGLADGAPFEEYAAVEAGTDFLPVEAPHTCSSSVQYQLRWAKGSVEPEGTSYTGQLQWKLYKDTVLFATKTFTFGIVDASSDDTTSLLGYTDLTCGDITASYISRVAFLEGNSSGYRTYDGFAHVTMRYFQSNGQFRIVDYGPVDFAPAGVLTLESPQDRRINIPLTPDDLVEWDGTSDLPLAGGGTGEVVATPAASPMDDRGFWEGLFGGVGGWLKDIYDRLGELGGILSDVLTGIQALPTTIADALVDAFVPQESLQTRVETSQAILSGKAPFQWIAAAAVQLPLLFSAGSECPEVTIPNAIGPWVDTVLTLCPPAGTADISRSLSRIGAAALLLAWGYSILRR